LQDTTWRITAQPEGAGDLQYGTVAHGRWDSADLLIPQVTIDPGNGLVEESGQQRLFGIAPDVVRRILHRDSHYRSLAHDAA
jgi:hypothetical protein